MGLSLSVAILIVITDAPVQERANEIHHRTCPPDDSVAKSSFTANRLALATGTLSWINLIGRFSVTLLCILVEDHRLPAAMISAGYASSNFCCI